MIFRRHVKIMSSSTTGLVVSPTTFSWPQRSLTSYPRIQPMGGTTATSPRSMPIAVRTTDTSPRSMPIPVRTTDTSPRSIPIPVKTSATSPRSLPIPVKTSATSPRSIPIPIRTSAAGRRSIPVHKTSSSQSIPIPIRKNLEIFHNHVQPDNTLSKQDENLHTLDLGYEGPGESSVCRLKGAISEKKENMRCTLSDRSKCEIFPRLFPSNACANVSLRMNGETSAVKVFPRDNALVNCVRLKEVDGESVAISLLQRDRANILWFDTRDKIINRYDPIGPGSERGQDQVDDTLREYLVSLLPEYTYLGNNLGSRQCVQNITDHGTEYYCIDYTLLYAINRIRGMRHEDAASALVDRGEDIMFDLAELFHNLEQEM